MVKTGNFVLLLILTLSLAGCASPHVRSDEQKQDLVVMEPPPPLAIFNLPALSTTTDDAEPHFVKITIALGYETGVLMKQELENRSDQIHHIINIMLRGKRFDELRGSDSTSTASKLIDLAEEIRTQINAILISGKIKEVYFKEFAVN